MSLTHNHYTNGKEIDFEVSYFDVWLFFQTPQPLFILTAVLVPCLSAAAGTAGWTSS